MRQSMSWRSVFLALGLVAINITSYAANSAASLDPEEEDTHFAQIPVDDIQEFVKIYGIVKDNYVDEKSDNALFLQAIKGLVGGLDRYSRYLSAQDYKQLLQYTEGDVASVDFKLYFDELDQHWKIKDLKNPSDSYALGLRNGQTVIKIDDQNLAGLSQEQTDALLNGSIGSNLNLYSLNSSRPYTLVRSRKIESDLQARLLDNDVLVIKVNVFQQDTAAEIERILNEYDPNKIKALLIDLRNNPGGLLSAAVETSDLFLSQGIIVSTLSRSEGNQQFQALPSNEFAKLKIGILINQRSASAAEVFTAALKEHQRAWVVGEKSYGKGVVQKLFALPDGSALQMTVSHYYTPNGSMIEGHGIQPNTIYPMATNLTDDAYIQNVSQMLLAR